MSILHTVNKSPFEKTAFSSCIDHASKGDTVLLIEDGVYAAMQGTAAADRIAAANGTVSICVLGPDLAARGIANGKVADGVKVVDYAGFVDLVAEHDVAQSWL